MLKPGRSADEAGDKGVVRREDGQGALTGEGQVVDHGLALSLRRQLRQFLRVDHRGLPGRVKGAGRYGRRRTETGAIFAVCGCLTERPSGLTTRTAGWVGSATERRLATDSPHRCLRGCAR